MEAELIKIDCIVFFYSCFSQFYDDDWMLSKLYIKNCKI